MQTARHTEQKAKCGKSCSDKKKKIFLPSIYHNTMKRISRSGGKRFMKYDVRLRTIGCKLAINKFSLADGQNGLLVEIEGGKDILSYS